MKDLRLFSFLSHQQKWRSVWSYMHPNVSLNQFTQAQKYFCTKDAISYGQVWKNLSYSDNSIDWWQVS